MREAVTKAQINCSPQRKTKKRAERAPSCKHQLSFQRGNVGRMQGDPGKLRQEVSEFQRRCFPGRKDHRGFVNTEPKLEKLECFLFLLLTRLSSDGRFLNVRLHSGLEPTQRRRWRVADGRPGARPALSLSGGGGMKKAAGTAGERKNGSSCLECVQKTVILL